MGSQNNVVSLLHTHVKVHNIKMSNLLLAGAIHSVFLVRYQKMSSEGRELATGRGQNSSDRSVFLIPKIYYICA